ncbi:hypothetical protein KCP75_01650 [Salmonella enterica subsp. enterica]|nr:hypothetical protein KCP75_01650 [Salmonella enterica subsp. enterica]
MGRAAEGACRESPADNLKSHAAAGVIDAISEGPIRRPGERCACSGGNQTPVVDERQHEYTA